jgi:sulfatase modifying factor 1
MTPMRATRQASAVGSDRPARTAAWLLLVPLGPAMAACQCGDTRASTGQAGRGGDAGVVEAGVAEGGVADAGHGEGDAGLAGADAEAGTVTDGGADAPVDAEAGPYGLEPTADCVHPTAEADCTDGWCRVPAGCFIYGSPENVECRGRYTEQQVQVTLTRPFLVAETEVTQAQWEAAGFPNPSPEPTCVDCPVDWISWYEALAYCNALSEQEGFEPCYDLSCCEGDIGAGCPPDRWDDLHCIDETNFQCSCEVVRHDNPYECTGYRLPSAVEWEYAARAGTRGDTYNGDLNIEANTGCIERAVLDPIAWYCANSGEVVHSVKGKDPNPWGLYDVIGNVREWISTCADGRSLEDNVGQPGPLVDPIDTYRRDSDTVRFDMGAAPSGQAVSS